MIHILTMSREDDDDDDDEVIELQCKTKKDLFGSHEKGAFL